MIHRVSHKKLSRSINSRKALLKNLANDLVLRERIVTTKAKAKSVRPYVEKLITRSRENTLNNRRILIAKLGREISVKKLLETVGPTFKDRPGGYTRILKMAPRAGDRAEMAILEFSVTLPKKIAAKKQEKTSKKTPKTEKPTVSKTNKNSEPKAKRVVVSKSKKTSVPKDKKETKTKTQKTNKK